MSKVPFDRIRKHVISKTNDFYNWKTRCVIEGELNINNTFMQVLNVHFGWTDEFEQFESQFDNALKCMNQEQLSIIGGDFNISSNSKEYRYIKEKGLQDLFDIEGFQEEPTFFGVHGECPEERRIDYIMSNKKIHVLKRELLFKTDPVSDHAALFISVVTD